jgi:nitrogen fixation NifU-like protein
MSVKHLYQDLVLDHGSNPRNNKELDFFNRNTEVFNPMCGDRTHVFIKLSDNTIIEEISFMGEGCAICIASSSIMTEVLKQKSEKADEAALSNIAESERAKLSSFISVAKFPMRIKCAILPWIAAESALHNKTKKINA